MDLLKNKLKPEKFRSMKPYPAPKISNPNHLDANGDPVPDQPEFIDDPTARYDMNEIFALTNCISANLRELADDIGSFSARIDNAKEKRI